MLINSCQFSHKSKISSTSLATPRAFTACRVIARCSKYPRTVTATDCGSNARSVAQSGGPTCKHLTTTTACAKVRQCKHYQGPCHHSLRAMCLPATCRASHSFSRSTGTSDPSCHDRTGLWWTMRTRNKMRRTLVTASQTCCTHSHRACMIP